MTINQNRRRFLERCGLVAAGVAGGAILPSALPDIDSLTFAQGAATQDAEHQLRRLGIELPPTSRPQNTYVPSVLTGNLLFLAGHGPRRPDGTSVVGKVGRDLDLEHGKEAARLVGLALLSSVRDALGSLNRVVRVVKTLGMVNATAEFSQQPHVINGCSDLMVEVFGETAGKGARSAVGVGSLPGGIAVEIEMVFQVRA